MPLYEYRCKKCDITFEVLLSVKDIDKPLEEPCKNCQELGSVERKIGNVTNIWKCSTGTASDKFKSS